MSESVLTQGGNGMPKPVKCSVSGCAETALFEVLLYDVYLDQDHLGDEMVFLEQDDTCPYLCPMHMNENEQQAQGVREPRGFVTYPYTNKDGAQGFTIYRPLSKR